MQCFGHYCGQIATIEGICHRGTDNYQPFLDANRDTTEAIAVRKNAVI
jgi:hypothetical protein